MHPTPYLCPCPLPQISPPIDVPPSQNIPAPPLPHPFPVIYVNHILATTPVDISNEVLSIPGVSPHDPATSFPDLTVLKLRFCLPWEIVVTASTRRYVTVGDILQTLHQVLRYPMTPQEMSIVMPTLSRNISTGTRASPEPLRIDGLYGHTVAHFADVLVNDRGVLVLPVDFRHH